MFKNYSVRLKETAILQNSARGRQTIAERLRTARCALVGTRNFLRCVVHISHDIMPFKAATYTILSIYILVAMLAILLLRRSALCTSRDLMLSRASHTTTVQYHANYSLHSQYVLICCVMYVCICTYVYTIVCISVHMPDCMRCENYVIAANGAKCERSPHEARRICIIRT